MAPTAGGTLLAMHFMDYGALPPEINSARIYSGPGSAPLRAAAASWQRLAAELNSTATSYSKVISDLTSQGWRGPSSMSMATATAPYLAWLRTTAAQAEQTAAQALGAANAYETARAMTVPPTAITTNRSTTVLLSQTNVFGQNTPAIAANEADYGEMWAQDVVAMKAYADSSASVSELAPFTSPPSTTAATGLAGHAATALPAAASDPEPLSVLGTLGTIATTLNTFAFTDIDLGGSLGVGATSMSVAIMNALANTYKAYGPSRNPADALTTPGGIVLVPGSGAGGLGTPVSAALGRAPAIGGLSVPQNWVVPPGANQSTVTVPSTTGPIISPADDGNLGNDVALAALIGSGMAGFAVLACSSAVRAAPTRATRAAASGTTASGTTAGGAACGRAVSGATLDRAVGGGGALGRAAEEVDRAGSPALPPLPAGIPPRAAANLAAALAAIPGATIIVVPPSPTE